VWAEVCRLCHCCRQHLAWLHVLSVCELNAQLDLASLFLCVGVCLQVVSRRLVHGQDHSRVPTVQMLERDLCNEVEGAGGLLGLAVPCRVMQAEYA
jgi:hypothetical protein